LIKSIIEFYYYNIVFGIDVFRMLLKVGRFFEQGSLTFAPQWDWQGFPSDSPLSSTAGNY